MRIPKGMLKRNLREDTLEHFEKQYEPKVLPWTQKYHTLYGKV